MTPGVISEEDLMRILAAGDWAPSHGDTEPWRFIAFANDGLHQLVKIFADCYQHHHPEETNVANIVEKSQKRVLRAAAWVAIGMEPELLDSGETKMRILEERLAVACAVQNMHLMASALGYAAMWHSKGNSVDPYVARRIGLADRGELLGFFQIGYPESDWPKGERRPLETKVRLVTESS